MAAPPAASPATSSTTARWPSTAPTALTYRRHDLRHRLARPRPAPAPPSLTGANTYTGGTTICGRHASARQWRTSGSDGRRRHRQRPAGLQPSDTLTLAARSPARQLAQTGTGTTSHRRQYLHRRHHDLGRHAAARHWRHHRQHRRQRRRQRRADLQPQRHRHLRRRDLRHRRLTRSAPAPPILTGDNTYTGGTTISAGTLQLGNGGTTGSIVGNVTDNGALTSTARHRHLRRRRSPAPAAHPGRHRHH